MRHRARRRVAILLPIGVMIISSIAAGLTYVPAGADGILPPANPASNIAPSSADWLSSIDTARAQEGVGTMDISQSALAALPVPEQMFAVLNIERVDRGLPPIYGMSAQLNSYAQAGANAMTDPPIPSAVIERSADHVGRDSLGRRTLRARSRLLHDVRRRLRRARHDEHRLQPRHAIWVLDPP